MVKIGGFPIKTTYGLMRLKTYLNMMLIGRSLDYLIALFVAAFKKYQTKMTLYLFKKLL